MQTSGLLMNNIWSDRVMRRTGVDLARVDAVASEATIMVDTVSLAHHGSEMNHRPYLQISGDLTSVVPDQPLPWDITEVTYDRGQERISAYYEFDDQELAGLVSKGYFGPDFRVPEEMTGIPWQLPITVDAVVVGPSGRDDGTNAAIVFLGVHEVADLRLNKEDFGYDLAEYFPDHSRTTDPEKAHEAWQQGPQRTSGGVENLFTEEDLALAEIEDPRAAQQNWSEARAQHKEQEQPRSEMDVVAEQIEADIEAEKRAYEQDLADQDGSDENLYSQRVAAYLKDLEEDEDDREAASAAEGRDKAQDSNLRDELAQIGMQDEENTVLFDEELDAQAVEAARTRRTARRRQNMSQAMRRPDGSGTRDRIDQQDRSRTVSEPEQDYEPEL